MLGNRDDSTSDNSSTRIGDDAAHGTGTTAGADVTSRMTGTHPKHATEPVHDTAARGVVQDTSRPAERYEHRARILPAKTSAAAVFALVFGLSALFCALTAILSPAAVVFGVIGLVLGVVGLKMAKRDGVTGKGVALGGLLTALLGLLLGGAVLAGASVVVNDEQRLDQLQTWIDERRADLPSGEELVEQVPGT